jgi:hypothetical protein
VSSRSTIDGRQRVRRHLAGRDADRPPLIAFATDLAARLEQIQARELWDDAGLLTRTLMGLQGLFGLEAIVVDVPLAALGSDRVAAVADGVARIRALVGDGAALVLAVPGPLTAAAAAGRDRAPETLEDLAAEILGAVKQLGPEHADCLAVVERAAVAAADAGPLDDALAPLWNTARYFNATGLLVAADGPAELGDTAADAVIVWAGAAPEALAERGARHVGVPIELGAPELPGLPGGGFYTTRGELPADTDIDALHAAIGAIEAGR